jgi:hypothetical protein
MPKPKSISLPGVSKRTVSYQLREAIEASGLKPYGVAKLADVDPGIVARFVMGEREIRIGTLDKIAMALGLRLVVVGNAPKRKKSAASSLTPETPDEPGSTD